MLGGTSPGGPGPTPECPVAPGWYCGLWAPGRGPWGQTVEVGLGVFRGSLCSQWESWLHVGTSSSDKGDALDGGVENGYI